MTHLSSLLICLVYSQLLRLLAFQFVPKPDWHNKAVTKLPISFSFFWLAFEQISGVRANLTRSDWWLFLIMKWCQPVGLNENCPLADWCSLAFWHSCGDSVDQPHDCMFRLEVWYYFFFSIWMKKKTLFLAVSWKSRGDYICVYIITLYVTLYVCIINFLLLPHVPICWMPHRIRSCF